MRRHIPLILLASYLAGCTSWRAQGVTPQQVINQRHPMRLRVTQTDGMRLVLENPVLLRDSVVGWTRAFGSRAVALADVKRVEARETDAGKTAGLILAVAAALATAFYLLALAALGGPGS